MPSNFYMFFVAGLIPLLVGFVYYNPKVFGNAWMKSLGYTEEDLTGANMGLIFLFSYLFACMLAFILSSMVIHQTQVFSMMFPDIFESGSAAQENFKALMDTYGDRHRSFGHGAAHGLMAALFIVLPIMGTNALFERRSWKYIGINFFYWLICLALMGGLLCQTLTFPEVI